MSTNMHALIAAGGVAERDWLDQALCREVDPELFYPEKGGSSREAKRICNACEAKDACLADALATGDRFGIRGGLSDRDRRKLTPAAPSGQEAA